MTDRSAGTPAWPAAIDAESAAGSKARIVTFDLNPDVVKAIQDKKTEFCVDQQPYLQGYEAVDMLWLRLSNGNDLGGGKAVLTQHDMYPAAAGAPLPIATRTCRYYAAQGVRMPA